MVLYARTRKRKLQNIVPTVPSVPDELKKPSFYCPWSSHACPTLFTKRVPTQLIAWLRRDDKMRVFNTLLQNATTKLYYLHRSNPWYLCGTYVSWKARHLNSKTGHKRRSQEREAKNMNQKADCIDTRRVYTQNHWKAEEKTRNSGKKNGAPTRTRTLDPMIKSHLLYRLSYGRTCNSILITWLIYHLFWKCQADFCFFCIFFDLKK